jgi:2-iminobutanoate/2-iminopropanoate deaminase
MEMKLMPVPSRSIIRPKNDLLNISKHFNIPHSPGVRANGFIFLSGMISIDPKTGQRKKGTINEEAEQILQNMKHMLESAGSGMEKVVRVLVMITDIEQWAGMNEIYRAYFPNDPPARSAIGVQLNNGMKVEMECTALE